MLKRILIGTLTTLVVTAVGASAYNTTIKPAIDEAAPQVAVASADATVNEAAPAVGAANQVEGAIQSAATVQNQAAGLAQGPAMQSQQWRGGSNGPGSPTASGEPVAAAGAGSGMVGSLGVNSAQAGVSGQGRGNRFGGGGQGRQSQSGSADGSAVPAPQNGFTDWISLDGSVSQVEYPTFVLTTTDGQTIPASVGNLNYATNLGIDLSDGETVSVIGYWDIDGTFAIGSLMADGQTYSLRDDYGRPLWSGAASH